MENQKYSVLFWLYQKKQKEGKSCIYVRITVDGKRAEVATPHYILPSQWDARRNRVKASAPDGVLINGALDHAANEIKKHFLNYVSRGEQISAPQLKELYLGKKEKTVPKTLLDAFEYHRVKMQSMIKVGKVAKATLAKYNYCQGKVEAFLKHRYKVKDKPLQDLSLKFVTEFEHFLLVHERMQTNSAPFSRVRTKAGSLAMRAPSTEVFIRARFPSLVL